MDGADAAEENDVPFSSLKPIDSIHFYTFGHFRGKLKADGFPNFPHLAFVRRDDSDTANHAGESLSEAT